MKLAPQKVHDNFRVCTTYLSPAIPKFVKTHVGTMIPGDRFVFDPTEWT